MPFYQPFKINPEPKDHLYGISGQRFHYCEKLPAFAVFRQKAAKKNMAMFIDEYKITPGELMMFFNETIDIWECYEEILRFQPLEFKSFFKSISRHKKYRSALQPGGNHLKDISRKIKAGLHWRTFDAHHHQTHIHFILDGIDFENVITKTRPGPFSPGFTNVELRWLYRNRLFKQVSDHIQFWIDEKPCVPPWHRAFAEYVEVDYDPTTKWRDYQPRSESEDSSEDAIWEIDV